MKPTPLPLLIALLLAIAPIGSAQESRPAPPRVFVGGGGAIEHQSQLTVFDLDFKGGTPKELVAAISQAMGRSLNAIVPDDVSGTTIPALNLTGVTVNQVFDALQIASVRKVVFQGRAFGRNADGPVQGQATFGFRNVGPGSDNTIWCFYVEDPSIGAPVLAAVPAPQCAIYQLGSYLERYKIEDITTAVETAWKMMDVKKIPEMKFHKDTQLLIAVGAPEQLSMISSVLSALDRGTPAVAPKPSVPPGAPAPKADKQ
jgi:hypothetical protein